MTSGLADRRHYRRLEIMTNGAHGSGDECLVIRARARRVHEALRRLERNDHRKRGRARSVIPFGKQIASSGVDLGKGRNGKASSKVAKGADFAQSLRPNGGGARSEAWSAVR